MGFQLSRLEIYGGYLEEEEEEEEVVWSLTKASSDSSSRTEISEVAGAEI
jgi:hypothetical protein